MLEGSGLIREAEISDLHILIEISREAFPESIVWKDVDGYSLEWWTQTIKSSYTKVPLYEKNSRVLGFMVLITDEEKFKNTFYNPKCRITFKIKTILKEPILLNCLIKRSLQRKFALIKHKEKKLNGQVHVGRRLWRELTGVKLSERRTGVGSCLNAWANDYAVENNYLWIESNIEPKNIANRSLMKKLGYEHIRQTKTGCTYSKKII